MKYLSSAAAALALAAIFTTTTTAPAKADGGAIAIGVGVFLLADAIVGRECQREDWPLNIIGKVADEIRGHDGCHRYSESMRDRPHHRHQRHHRRHHNY